MASSVEIDEHVKETNVEPLFSLAFEVVKTLSPTSASQERESCMSLDLELTPTNNENKFDILHCEKSENEINDIETETFVKVKRIHFSNDVNENNPGYEEKLRDLFVPSNVDNSSLNYMKSAKHLNEWLLEKKVKYDNIKKSLCQEKIQNSYNKINKEMVNDFKCEGFNSFPYFSNIRKITDDVKPVESFSFSRFNLCSEIVMALNEKNWKWPSPIQDKVIQKITEGESLIARSKNGTGKTGAFAISLLNKIDVTKKLQVIILEPTRELALQTSNVCISIAKYRDGLNIMVATGGTNLVEDIYRIRNEKVQIHVIIASPQRILDLIRSRLINIEDLKTLVLDEADKLLSVDYVDMVLDIINELPICQKLLFSATFPVKIKDFADEYMKGCGKYNLMNELTLKGISQYYAYVKEDQKISCLRLLLRELEVKQCIIFCNSTKRVELLARKMIEWEYTCFYIHSKLDQLSRNKAFHDFRQGSITYLVSTDIMTRGIDIPNINVVFNFDFPKYAETYLHRIGRGGRFGHLAIAINFITENDKNGFFDIEHQIGSKIKAIPKSIDKGLYASSFQTEEKH